MAKIGQGTLKDFMDGEYVRADDLDQIFETVRVALNDADDKASNSIGRSDDFERRVNEVEFVGNQRNVRIREVFIATEGQTLFTLTKGEYKLGGQLLDVTISNYANYVNDVLDTATVWNSLIYDGKGLTETSSTSFTLDTPVIEGAEVTATYYLAHNPLGATHGSTHNAGGFDEINVTELAGYDIVVDAINVAKNEAATDAQDKADIAETNAKSASVPLTQKAAANGVATLGLDSQLVQKPYVTGTYNGTTTTYTDTSWRSINLGFRPKAVYVENGSDSLGDWDYLYKKLILDGTTSDNIQITSTGFDVRVHLNGTSISYQQESSVVNNSLLEFRYVVLR